MAPIFSTPDVNASVPVTITFLFTVNPCASLTVKLTTVVPPAGISLNEPVCKAFAAGPYVNEGLLNVVLKVGIILNEPAVVVSFNPPIIILPLYVAPPIVNDDGALVTLPISIVIRSKAQGLLLLKLTPAALATFTDSDVAVPEPLTLCIEVPSSVNAPMPLPVPVGITPAMVPLLTIFPETPKV